jgi:hypothetical protein
MPDLEVTLTLRDLTIHKPPRETNLLFYNENTHSVAKGWLQPEGLVLVGGNWRPTHFVDFAEAAKKQR